VARGFVQFEGKEMQIIACPCLKNWRYFLLRIVGDPHLGRNEVKKKNEKMIREDSYVCVLRVVFVRD
jgi:hypothetical protein